MDTKVVSTIVSHGPGYLDKDKETIVGFQTDKPFKRALMPYGGIRMAEKALSDNGYLIKVTDVVGVKIGDAPGKLTAALSVLDKSGINMEYLYAFMARTERHAYVVLRVEDNEIAESALEREGFHLITDADINKL